MKGKARISVANKANGKINFELVLIVLGIVFIAANLRAPITSVGPVITELSDHLQLRPALVGLLTAIPLMSFALLSVFAPKLGRKIGLEKLLLYSLLVLAFGLFIRSFGNVFLLFFGAALIGAAITVGNVLMPAFIKKEFPTKVGIVTGVYLVSMNFTSALAAGFSIQIGELSGFGWRGSIGIWGFLALLGFLIWFPQARKASAVGSQPKPTSKTSLWTSGLAWNIAVFMGLQSLLFYCFAAWLPTILQSWGMSADRSGWMLSFIQMAQLPIMLIGPILAARMKNQQALVWVTVGLLLLGLAGITFGKTTFIIPSVISIGIALGLAFTLAMMFMVLRTKQTTEAAELSGMSQTVGYIIAACGPPVFGALFSLTDTWYYPLGLLVIATLILCKVGLTAAKDSYISF